MPVVVAFVSQKGGVGKSTLARALAVVATSAHLNVKLADLDPLQRTLLMWMKRRNQKNVEPAVLVEGFANFDEAWDSAVSDDLLVVDAPGQVGQATLELARRADLLVQPTGPGLDDLHPAVLVFDALVNLGVSRERLVFAICRSLTESEEDAARAYLEKAGYAVLPGSIPEKVAYREAHNRGRALTEAEKEASDVRATLLLTNLYLKLTSSR